MSITKKLSEVCRIVGVTRRTLQEYDRIKLLCPTARSERGYWLYDDEAIQKLIIIQLFVDAGYERKRIKDLFVSNTDLLNEIDHAVEALKVQRQRLNGMINTLNSIKRVELQPEEGTKMEPSCAGLQLFQEKSFKELLNDCVDNIKDVSEQECAQMKELPNGTVAQEYLMKALEAYVRERNS